MYQVSKTPYGFHLTFGGHITQPEMEQWVKECQAALAKGPKSFSVLVDMRDLKPLPPEVRGVMEKGQEAFKKGGMARSAVVLHSAMLAMQFKNIAKESGIYAWERYVNTEENPDWEKRALGWVEKGIDPDLKV